MSLEGLIKEIEDSRKIEQARWMATIREQYESTIRAKDEEIAVLKEEIETLRRWLDHSALPAANPISKRPEALGLIKLNFGKDKPPPEMWRPGEKEIMDSIGRDRQDEAESPGLREEAEPPATDITDTPSSIQEPPKPERIDLPEQERSEPMEFGITEPEEPEPLEAIPLEPEEPEPHKIPQEPSKTETPRPVSAARRISRLRGPAKRRAGRGRLKKSAD